MECKVSGKLRLGEPISGFLKHFQLQYEWLDGGYVQPFFAIGLQGASRHELKENSDCG
jgi:hypothetical protein